jgi:hypothetical protein
MNKIYGLLFSMLSFQMSFAQTNVNLVDNKYLEDQIYISATYNLLLHKPSLINQNGFSGGFSIGFIKDLPINKPRTIGFGVGIGYSFNALIQNLKISQNAGLTTFNKVIDYTVNKITLNSLEFPIEFRWRNSSPSRYRFWRIYSGIKFSYLMVGKTKYKDSNEIIVTKNIKELNRFQYGLTLAIGYGTWNLYMYYAINPLFNNAFIYQEKINSKQLNIGFKFYIM